MGSKLYGINPGQCTYFMCPVDDRPQVVNCTHCIRGISHSYNSSTLSNLCPHILHVECHIFWVNINGAYQHTMLLQRKPGSNIRIVIQNCHYNLIPCLQRFTNSTTKSKSQGGHIWAENNLIWAGSM